MREEPVNKVAPFPGLCHYPSLISYMHSMQHTAGNHSWWAGNEVNVDYLIHLKKFLGIQPITIVTIYHSEGCRGPCKLLGNMHLYQKFTCSICGLLVWLTILHPVHVVDTIWSDYTMHQHATGIAKIMPKSQTKQLTMYGELVWWPRNKELGCSTRCVAWETLLSTPFIASLPCKPDLLNGRLITTIAMATMRKIITAM